MFSAPGAGAGARVGSQRPRPDSIPSRSHSLTPTGPAPLTMARSDSSEMREHCEDLKEAAEQNLNVVVDMDLDGHIRWVSNSWEEVIGTPTPDVFGQLIEEALFVEKSVFDAAIQRMKADDSRSQIIRFPIVLGHLSKIARKRVDSHEQQLLAVPADARPPDFPAGPDMGLLLEAQGIMVSDRAAESEDSHIMWMLRPAKVRKVTLDLPNIVAESLGVGAEMLAQYLERIAEAGGAASGNEIKPPEPVFCHICERQIPPWWFEKHTDLCFQEHKAEMEVQMAHENLNEHRNAIVKVLDALEPQHRPARSMFGPLLSEQLSNSPSPSGSFQAEYKGLPIGSSNPASGPSSGRASPAISRSRERPPPSFGHHRGRSFAVRRPVIRIVELILDLCDTALEINTPALKESTDPDSDPRTQSPQSENRVTQVLQWQSPTTGAGGENEPGLMALCQDTEGFARTKVEAVIRFRRLLEYSERIRVEFSIVVQECVDTAIRKATQIATGESSTSSDCDSDENAETEIAIQSSEEPPSPTQATSVSSIVPPSPGVFSDRGISTPVRLLRQSSMAAALKSASESNYSDSTRTISTRSNSPHPSSSASVRQTSMAAPGPSSNKRASMLYDPDNGTESDTSVHSSLVSQTRRSESPATDMTAAPKPGTFKDRAKRRSFMLSNVISSRQQSPSRMSAAGQPSSPYRFSKSRSFDVSSPMTSPLLGIGTGTGEFGGSSPPVIPHPQSQPVMHLHHHHASHSSSTSHHNHHRRQSSAASSELTRPSVSPRLLPVMSNQQPRASPPSIKDFEIIKPISKGAFGSVYLSKKKSTGDYFAIKVLKKSDMVAKNQVTNVKAERAIMMWQGESDFVAKLYWTFASKDYLYLVMEYLNGGDLASLIKVLGGLPESWGQKYLAEIVLGVEHLHSRGIVHRDLKPDNLLVDQKGHLKLTDFGLSRMGMLGRQNRALQAKSEEPMPDLLKGGPFHRSSSIVQLRSSSFDLHNKSPAQTPNLVPAPNEGAQPPYIPIPPSRSESFSQGSLRRTSSVHRNDNEPSEGYPFPFRSLWPSEEGAVVPPPLSTASSRLTASTLDLDPLSLESAVTDGLSQLTINRADNGQLNSDQTQCSTPTSSTMPHNQMPLFDPEDTSHRRFVGTPDYLAPETVSGEAQDERSDWWSIGCILFELLYGYPPFHADTPETVFQNILARNILWPGPDEVDVSNAAIDLMNRLMAMDPSVRLGSNTEERFSSGGEEIKAHPWFSDVNWESILEDEASFVPAPEHPEDTEYFDSRGACDQNFASEFEDQTKPVSEQTSAEFSRPYDALSKPRTIGPAPKRGLMPLSIPPHVREGRNRRQSESTGSDDFGSFSYKNLPVLEKANKDVIQKLRAEAKQTQVKSPSVVGSPSNTAAPTPSLEGSPIIQNPVSRTLSNNRLMGRPASPIPNYINASPSRGSQPSSPMMVSSFNATQNALRKASSCSSGSASQGSNFGFPTGFNVEFPRAPQMGGHKSTLSTGSSPIRIMTKPQSVPLAAAFERVAPATKVAGSSSELSSPRLAPGLNPDLGPKEGLQSWVSKRHVSGMDASPSSSDSEGTRQKALLRVQRRRQSSRRLSHISGIEGPFFRPLDILICDDHPISRLVLEKLLEKLKCRTISVSDGSEAVRYATSEVQFDIILLEYKLPQLSGPEVARMVKTTKNSNSHTPIVSVTSYLQDLQSISHFDSLIEKPLTLAKLSDVLTRLCNWRQPPPDFNS